MDIAALVPARGGSRRIPGKNLKDLDHHSLLWHAVAKLDRAGLAAVHVSTDDDEIAREAIAAGAVPLRRPPELAGPDVMMLEVVRHALDALPDADAILVHQCTSPLTSVADLRRAADMLEDADYVVTVAPLEGVVHARTVRPFWEGRRERRVGWRETGGAFGIRRGAIGREATDIRIARVEQHPSQAIDIDWPWQLEAARALWPAMRWRVYGAADMPMPAA